VISFVIFFLFFLFLLWYVFTADKKFIDKMKRLPFDQEPIDQPNLKS
jgi:cbb3-type cytochrome oxidase subunit 3